MNQNFIYIFYISCREAVSDIHVFRIRQDILNKFIFLIVNLKTDDILNTHFCQT